MSELTYIVSRLQAIPGVAAIVVGSRANNTCIDQSDLHIGYYDTEHNLDIVALNRLTTEDDHRRENLMTIIGCWGK